MDSLKDYGHTIFFYYVLSKVRNMPVALLMLARKAVTTKKRVNVPYTAKMGIGKVTTTTNVKASMI